MLKRPGKPSSSLRVLTNEIAACRICEPHLPLGPRPVVSFGARARIMIVGQAPGTKVHNSGVPWDDDSGDHLREWLRVDKEVFYDRQKFAIVPMGFCYPGKKKGGDAPPRPECAPAWHAAVSRTLPKLELTLLSGMYAQKYYLGDRKKRTLSATVDAFAEYAPEFMPLPHPSWRSRGWIEKNPWFKTRLLPVLRKRVRALIDGA